MDGGYGWAISRAALQAWKPALDRCVPAVAANMRSLLVSQERCKLPPGEIDAAERWCAEDVFLTYCLREHAGATLFSWPWSYRGWLLEKFNATYVCRFQLFCFFVSFFGFAFGHFLFIFALYYFFIWFV